MQDEVKLEFLDLTRAARGAEQAVSEKHPVIHLRKEHAVS